MYLYTFVATLTIGFSQGLPPGIKDTQNPKDFPPPPQEAARRLKVPEGFRVTLFAGEPDVCQPIALAFDDRCRMWVGECFSYPTWVPPEKAGEGRDRILIFEDTDGDGRFDKRTVFWDRAYNLSGLTLGYGGVWALCAPNLLFIPLREGDDRPAGPPQVILDGWTLKAGHNIVNGLTWGPDGWLYGRHGITAESKMGKPGTPDKDRVRLNCSIWRYHPTRKVFEVVTHGTTNPWGLDFDDHGQAFFTNSVIGHLWHVVPGARYERMYGQDYNPHAYELIPSTSDHLHWGGGHWAGSRDGKGIHGEAGGGHAHSGAMIYLGDNWPDAYRHKIYMGNIHGNRLNVNLLERKGAGYVGKRAADFLTSDNPWFRPIWLDYGSDGGVYVGDWCDLGECHDYDGVHRSSGRIYKITFGKPKPVGPFDLTKKSDAELVALQLHKNDWHVRHARRLLAERAAAGKDMTEVHNALHKMFDKQPEVSRKLRALWALYVSGGLTQDWLLYHLRRHPDEYIRSWVIRLLCDKTEISTQAIGVFFGMAIDDPSPLVRLSLASAIQRIQGRSKVILAGSLSRHPRDDSHDPVLPLLIWHGVESWIGANPQAAVKELIRFNQMPKLRQFTARRLGQAAKKPADLSALIAELGQEKNPDALRDLLHGLRDGLKGRSNFAAPAEWDPVFKKLEAGPATDLRDLARLVGLIFNDPRAVAALRATLTDARAPPAQRATALQALVDHPPTDLPPLLFKLVHDPAVRGPVLRGLAAFADDQIPPLLLGLYSSLNFGEKQDALGTLASRPKYALALLDAIDRKKIPRADVSVFTGRQLQDLRDKQVSEKLTKVWGQLRTTPPKKRPRSPSTRTC